MVRCLFVCLLIITFFPGYCQNLVPNPGFENHTKCPNSLGQIQCPLTTVIQPTLASWFSPLPNSPDYYQNCALPTTQAHVPNNPHAYLPTYSGHGYVGIILYGEYSAGGTVTPVPEREHVECKLLQPLVAGQTYIVSCWIKNHAVLSTVPPNDITTNYNASDALEVHFSTNLIASYVGPLAVTTSAKLQLPSKRYITDTNWVKVSGKYTANGGEQYLTLGHFSTTAPSMIHAHPPTPISNHFNLTCYYMIDEMAVHLEGTTLCDTIIKIHDDKLCEQNGMTLSSSFSGNNYTWSTGATTAQIKVSSVGTYWRIADTGNCNAYIDTFHIAGFDDTIHTTHYDTLCAGLSGILLTGVGGANTYKWNTGVLTQSINVNEAGTYICNAVSECKLYVDSFNVAPYNTTVKKHDKTLCLPGDMEPTVTDADSFRWSTGATDITISISQPGNYTCFAYKNCDIYIDSFSIKQTTNFDIIDMGSDVTMCEDEKEKIGVSYPGAGSYKWNTGEEVCCILPGKSGMYHVQIDNGCNILEDSIVVDIVSCEDCLFIPSAFSPNGDGINDNMQALSNCPLSSFRFQIYNRFGELVYGSNNISDKWDGRYKEQKADMGTYYYMVEYIILGNGERTLKKGDITLIY